MPKPLTPPDDEFGINLPDFIAIHGTTFVVLVHLILAHQPEGFLPLFLIDYVLKDYVLITVSYV